MMKTIESLKKEIAAAQDFWRLMLPMDAPEERQFAVWLSANTLGTVTFAIEQTAKKCSHLNGQMNVLYARRFVSAVCHRITTEKQKQVA